MHANTPRDALSRIETMVLMAGYDLPVKAIRQQVASALDLIVHLERLEDGSRRVTAITEVQRMESDVITLQDLFEFKVDEVTSDRVVIGALDPTGLRPTFLYKFEKRGMSCPSACSPRTNRTRRWRHRGGSRAMRPPGRTRARRGSLRAGRAPEHPASLRMSRRRRPLPGPRVSS